MTGFAAYKEFGLTALPIDTCLGQLCDQLNDHNSAVLVAPPGAGKTSRVPLALLNATWMDKRKLIVLEPRRLAARAAGEHMANLLSEPVGQTVGYRVRMDSKIGPKTRIEFVTEGVFTRMVLDDPELTGVAGVLFDEFHERSLEADLGLALALDVQSSLRNDLRILPMSATLDGAAVSNLMGDCPVIESQGRSFPVDIRYDASRPDTRIEDKMASAIRFALRGESGSILCFLPGQGEIRRTAERLEPNAKTGGLPDDVDLHMLYGTMSPQAQRAAIAPAKDNRRKIVLATAIAQTSLTLEGVRIVIDSGLSRVPQHDPASGLTKLSTIRASKATITQRAGRAGRTQPGIAIRLWHEGQTTALADQEQPELLGAELSKLVLDLAAWGVSDPGQLKWLDHPPKPAWDVAVKILKSLKALDNNGVITGSGRKLQNMPLPPRLGHMVMAGAKLGLAEKAARLALLISERGIGGNGIDLGERLDAVDRANDTRSKSLKNAARSIVKSIEENSDDPTKNEAVSSQTAGLLISFAWPERIAKRVGDGPYGEAQYLLANGRRALLDGLVGLARAKWLAVSDVQGKAASGRITGAGELGEEDVFLHHAEAMTERRETVLDEKTGRFLVLQTRHLGAIELSRERTKTKADEDVSILLIRHFRENGLAKYLAGKKSDAFLGRLRFLHHHFPDQFQRADEDALLNDMENWLMPMLTGVRGPGDLDDHKMLEALKHFAGFEALSRIERLAPQRWTLPTGNGHLIEYEGKTATLRARVQEFFGLSEHPAICEGRVPLTLDLLSPAMRPLQKTLDIARFWGGSWQDVRKDMRGRYPKHVWPEDPANAVATSRAKPRK